MSNSLTIALFMALGIALGAFFFGGLWLTVKKGMSENKNWIWFLTSFVIRTCAVMGAFYLIAVRGGADRLLASLAGFLTAHITAKIFLFPKGPGTN